MNPTELKVTKWLYANPGQRAARALAYEYLLGTDADRDHVYPQESHEFHICLNLLEDIPELRPALRTLAGKSRYWAALERHWDTLRDMLSEETNGTMVYPSANNTSATLRDLIGRVSSGHDLPDLRLMGFDCKRGRHQTELVFEPEPGHRCSACQTFTPINAGSERTAASAV